MILWDAHLHAYPAAIAADPQTWAERMGEAHWWDLHSQKIQSWFSIEQLLAEMDRCGVKRGVILGWYWETPEACDEWNEWALELKQSHGDRFFVFASIHPSMKLGLDELHEMKLAGFDGLGECLPYVQESSFQDNRFQLICQNAGELGLPVNLHVTEPNSHDYPGKVPTPHEGLLQLIEACPKTQFILSHWGGGLPFYADKGRLKDHLDHLWFDSAASPLLYGEDIWKRVVSLVGEDRMLFGSDFPLNLYPRKQKRAAMDLFLKEFSEQITESSAFKKIAFENLKTLLDGKV